MSKIHHNQKISDLISRGVGYSDYRTAGTIHTHTVGPVGLIALPGSVDFVKQVDHHLYTRRMDYLQDSALQPSSLDEGTLRDSYIIQAQAIRFQSGEGKGLIEQTVRGHDLYIFCDVMNHSVTFNMYGEQVPLGPDDHFQDLVRIILAATGKASRLNVVMPFLYQSRQPHSSSRESLDCAYMLQELDSLGVENIITFDAHDPRVENALPDKSLENIPVSFGLIQALLKEQPDLQLEGEHSIMVISPDELGLKRSTFYASIMEVPLGTFYRQREYLLTSNPRDQEVIDFKFLGESPAGRDVVIIDDMIVSGKTLLETARRLKEMKAKRVFCLITFPLCVDGVKIIQDGVDAGIIDRVFATNLIYHRPELDAASWFTNVDMTHLSALLVDAINHNASISNLIDQTDSIKNILNEHNQMHRFMDLESKNGAHGAADHAER